MPDLTTHHVITHAHLFCGLGGGAKGFNAAKARHGALTASFECLGGIDVDPAAIRDFERLSGVKGTVLDLFDHGQYRDFHGADPAPDWSEATTADIHRAFNNRKPHILFLSAPCKGFSGLLSETMSRTGRYQALNRLTLRGIWLALEAYKEDPVEFILFENVPRIATRGRHLLDQIVALLGSYGYAVAETTHDCGALGGLSQSRKRFLLVARHAAKVRPFLWEPPKRAIGGVGDVLGRMRLPGDPLAGPMHRVPRLQWQTWARLAFIEAGKDWRSLQRLAVENGVLRDYLLVSEQNWRGGPLGVVPWSDAVGVVAGRSNATNGRFNVADPRIDGHERSVQHGIRRWEEPAPVVTGKMLVGGGPHAVADPRDLAGSALANEYRIVPWTGDEGVLGEPRGSGQRIADPRPNLSREKGDPYLTAGHYGVVSWDDATGAVSAAAGHDNGRWAVADPRETLPCATEKLVAVIRALDGTWHRPFTTAELAALQSLYDPEEQAELDGLNDSAWRERIGNAVPPDAARAIAETMGRTLLAAWNGETFMLGVEPIWVRPIAVAASVDVPLPA
ncbi:DNA cytosine methyltransferase [Asaia krungthepensis]|uniref:C-5 cytosine-specific DNA methylase n=1 Tax=Asaia krungthepensis NRIC 0535 TaxID=1307925 RepID=A0ABQ0Q4K9_9PROT|nr:DNA cytosine methyltransferase [Asaia krungthepensis]GBQ91047.1 C-5 cytosine-specific DNA methylase [Asaia krungthepensis NRIC 0535]